MLGKRVLETIEERVRRELKKPEMITHDFNHCKRVGIGAKWFVRVLKGKKEEEELAYLAGLLHDIVRPATEKIDHAILSAEKAKAVLEELGLPEKTTQQIVLPILHHRKPVPWKSPLHQSVYLADKILEQMGAYVIFRRSVFVGECTDYKDKPFLWSIKHQFKRRLERFSEKAFPEKFRGLVKYQYSWPKMFFGSLEKEEEWAVDLGREGYEIGKTRTSTVDEFIQGFHPNNWKAEKVWKEALEYIEGKKFTDFKKLIKEF